MSNLEENSMKELKLIASNQLFLNKKIIFEIECSQFFENVTGDLKASNLFLL